MSEEAKDSGKLTNVMLVLLALLAAGAGGAVVHFHQRLEDSLAELRGGIREYDDLVRMAPEIAKLRTIEKDIERTNVSINPVTYLGEAFTRHGFASDRFTVTPENERPVGGWREKPYKIQFTGKRDDTVERSRLVNTLSVIEREHPGLKSKDLTFTFADGDAANDFRDAMILFARFERK